MNDTVELSLLDKALIGFSDKSKEIIWNSPLIKLVELSENMKKTPGVN